jgi:hypothetical protein
MQHEINGRFAPLFKHEVMFQVSSHSDTHAMYAWLLGTYNVFLSSSISEQDTIDASLSASCESIGVKVTKATSTLHKIVKLATGGDTKTVSGAVRIINVMVENGVQEHNCVDWIKTNGGLNAVKRWFNKDGSVRTNDKLSLLTSFVRERINSNLTQDDLISLMFDNSKELAGILSR